MRKKLKLQKEIFIIIAGGFLLVCGFLVDVLTMLSVYGLSDEEFAGTEKSLSAQETAAHIGGYFIYAGIGVLLLGIALLIFKSVKRRTQ